MLAFAGYDPKKIAEYVLFLSRRDKKPITPMQLLKLVYICHGWMLGLYGRPLSREAAEAWTYGPVLPSLYQAYKRYGGQSISADSDLPICAPMKFDQEAESVIRQVWDGYSGYTGLQLSAMTHRAGTPWEITWNTVGHGVPISNDLIEDHYRKLAQNRG
jgi:uncharacterized phage-associated protein